MVSTYKGKVTGCSNNFAITTDGLGEALKRSSASMKTAGNTLEETIALVATANETIQNPETVGNAWKTISMRLRGLVAEDDEDGDTVWKPAKLNKLIYDTTKSQTGQGISLLTDDGAFKNTYEIIKDIAKVWNQLDSKSQSGLLEKMAGKHRATVLAATLSDVERLEEAFEKASNAGNSAMDEWQKRTTSIEYAIGQLNATWQEFSQNTIPKETIIRFINLAQSALEAVESIGALKIAMTALGGFTGLFVTTKVFPWASNPDVVKNYAENVRGLGDQLKDLKKSYTEAGSAGNFLKKGVSSVTPAVKTLGKAISASLATIGKSAVILAGFYVVTTIVGKVISYVKNMKHAVSNLQEEIDDLSSSIDSLKSEQEELESKDVLTSAEKDRLDYLNKKVALEERALELKKQQQANEFIEDARMYNGGYTAGVNSELQDVMDDSDDVVEKYKDNSKAIDEQQKKLMNLLQN